MLWGGDKLVPKLWLEGICGPDISWKRHRIFLALTRSHKKMFSVEPTIKQSQEIENSEKKEHKISNNC